MAIFDFRKKLQDTPKEVLNGYLVFALLTFGFMGLGRGLDEGGVSGLVTQQSFISNFNMNAGSKKDEANRQSNITSMVQIGAVGGTILAFFLHDRMGRVRSLQFLCSLWILGYTICVTSFGSYSQLLVGRFIGGLGIGQTTVVGPTYLAEVAPRSVRGGMTSIFAGAVYLGTTIAYFANYGTSLHISNNNRLQWVVPQLINIIFPAMLLAASFFAIESPRWLLKKNRDQVARENLSHIRQLPQDDIYVLTEIMDTQGQLAREYESTMETSHWQEYHELFTLRANLYRLMIGVVPQVLGQFSGASSITIYAPKFFAILGTTGKSEKLFATAIVGVVKFTAAMLAAVFLIDFLGRRRSLYIGIGIQIVATLYIAIFLAIPGSTNVHASANTSRAGTGAIAMIYIAGIGWVMGMNSFQYIVGPEIFPLRLRNLATSLIMMIHFLSQYASSKAVPSMLISLNSYGTFFFFAAVNVLILAFVWLFVPETSGLSLEGIDAIFTQPWFQIGRHGRALAMAQDREITGHLEKSGIDADHVEVSRR